MKPKSIMCLKFQSMQLFKRYVLAKKHRNTPVTIDHILYPKSW